MQVSKYLWWFFWKNKSLELTRVGRTCVYMIFYVDSHTFSTRHGGLTRVNPGLQTGYPARRADPGYM